MTRIGLPDSVDRHGDSVDALQALICQHWNDHHEVLHACGERSLFPELRPASNLFVMPCA